ncbi:type III secretion low calcium response chaperone LcrH/SycD [Anaerohalosphaera lusitana]|uniref:Type III secretion low calcium response chaperone LcrH/SycD n=2 Tax=Anaerohalosphaera lusitana TaxID=1936003 RepID=A0A1U9NI40_9BACT|nr:type III secretion low calcium response chaperone LcrH/SycD [Anaerohalosphaera lusitana]
MTAKKPSDDLTDKGLLLRAMRFCDPISIWECGAILDFRERYDSAKKCFKRILSLPFRDVLSCSDLKRDEVHGIKNDSRLRISQCCLNMSQYDEALKWMNQHIRFREQKYPSAYTDDEAKNILLQIETELESYEASQKLSELIAKEKWDAAEDLIKRELEREPDCAWWYSQLSSVLYEMHKYQQALEYSEMACEIAPCDPLYLWHYAGALNMLGRNREAIKIYKKILAMGPLKVGSIHTSEGIRWAKSLLNDCRYRVGLCYSDLRRKGLAKRWLKSHIENRSPGIPSIYKKSEVIAKLNSLDNAKCNTNK